MARLNELPVLNAMRDWRRSFASLSDIRFYHVLDRGETGGPGTQSRLSLEMDPSQTRAVVGYKLTEEMLLVALTDASKQDASDILDRLRAAVDGQCDYLHGAAIHSHYFQGALIRPTSRGLVLTIGWAGRVSWNGLAPCAEFEGVASGLAVAFADASPGHPASWAWTFGDGGTDTAQNPAHTYAAPGTYTVALTTRNRAGRSVTTKTVTV